MPQDYCQICGEIDGVRYCEACKEWLCPRCHPAYASGIWNQTLREIAARARLNK